MLVKRLGGLQRQILDTLSDRLAADPEEVLPYAHARVALDPDDEAAWARLVSLLVRAGRPGEARAQYDAARGVLAEVGGTTRLLQDALNVEVAAPLQKERENALHQEIRFCHAPGGVRIAYATVGRGPPLVKTANWLNHLEYDWESPIWSHLLRGLARRRTLLRYDARGNGLSDWEVGELSLDAWVSDLETVVDAAKFERFPLFGVSQGCAISIAYAVRHPERVSHLILYSGQAAGLYARNDDPIEIEKRRALTTLVRHGWVRPIPRSARSSRRHSYRMPPVSRPMPSTNCSGARRRPNALRATSRRPPGLMYGNCSRRSARRRW